MAEKRAAQEAQADDKIQQKALQTYDTAPICQENTKQMKTLQF